MTNRAGPLMHLLWELNTNPVFREAFKDSIVRDRQGVVNTLPLRGIHPKKAEETLKALEGNYVLLEKLLLEEEKEMATIWGVRAKDNIAKITCWPEACPPPVHGTSNKPSPKSGKSGKK